ncbi:MAG TPA: glycosyl hydrolase family 32 [Humibacter sp.]|nr:glycosyl hydrolase family 32 [Humibacter sp.]
MLQLPDSWTWDFWIADTGDAYHLFFLFASKALHDPERRHGRASIGHAVSKDLINWDRLPDVLVRGDEPSFDDVATWTGSTVRGDDGLWYLFYTGNSSRPAPGTQRIGVAVSEDLITFTKVDSVVVEAHPSWYEKSADSLWFDEAWRDPWVFRDAAGEGWHMLITARANHGETLERGVVGHAVSSDLLNWTVLPPITEPGGGFGQLEVPQVEVVDGRHVLIFSCLTDQIAERRRDEAGTGGVWAVIGDGPLGPFDIEQARLIVDHSRYAGRIVRDRSGEWQFLAFRNHEGGAFVGELADPVPFVPLLAAAYGSPAAQSGSVTHGGSVAG